MLRTISLALCLPLLAAAKPVLDNEGYAPMTIRLLSTNAADQGQQLEVQSWHWGPRQSTGRASTSGHSMLGASDRTTIHDPPPPRDGGLGSESELTVRPHPRGSLVVNANLPGCAVGKRYAGAQFASATMRYELKDVVISNCAPGGVTLDYRKVTVKGWNPETKEL